MSIVRCLIGLVLFETMSVELCPRGLLTLRDTAIWYLLKSVRL